LSLWAEDKTKGASGTLGEGGPTIRVTVRRGDIELLSNDTLNEAVVVTLPIPFSDGGVNVDGELEPAWGDAVSVALDVPDNPAGGEVRLLRDASQLYLYAALPVDDWHRVTAIAVDPDDPHINGDDAFDVFLGVENRAYRITVNPFGAVYDAQTLDDSEDPSWNVGATARTAIGASWWAVEMAIPFAGIGVAPTGDVPFDADFQHVSPSRNRTTPTRTRFTLNQPPKEPLLPLSVTVSGGFSPDVVLQAVGSRSDGRVRLSEVTALEPRLLRLGWFQSVNVSVAGESVVVALEEPRAFEVQDLRFLGFNVVSETFCRDRLGWRTGWTTPEAIEARRVLTENFYRSTGYEVATVKTWIVGKVLFLEVDEGIIEEMTVSGASKITPAEVIYEMRSLLNAPYRAQAVEEALLTARRRLAHAHAAFRNLSSGGIEKVNGRWTLRLHIEETPPRKVRFTPTVRYSSVHGWEVGAFAHLFRETDTTHHLFGELSHIEGMSRVDGKDYRWNYRIGLLIRPTLWRAVAVGADWSRRTILSPWQGTGSLLDTSVAFLTGGGSATYYAVESRSFFLRFLPSSRMPFDVGLAHDATGSLRRIVERSLFGRTSGQGNRPIDDGERIYMFARWTFDGRDHRTTPTDPLSTAPEPSVSIRNGIWMGFDGEGGTFSPRVPPTATKRKGKLSYARLKGDVRIYLTLSRTVSLDARFRGQWTRNFLPSQLGVWLGGGNTLPGWNESRLFGDAGAVGSIEMRQRLSRWGLFFAGFGDGGFVRPAKGTRNLHPAYDIGFGLGVELGHGDPSSSGIAKTLNAELLRMDVAFPLTTLNREKWSPNVLLRLNRRF